MPGVGVGGPCTICPPRGSETQKQWPFYLRRRRASKSTRTTRTIHGKIESNRMYRMSDLRDTEFIAHYKDGHQEAGWLARGPARGERGVWEKN